MKLDKTTLRMLKIYKKAKRAQRKLARHRKNSTKQQRDAWKLSLAKAMRAFPTPAELRALPTMKKLGFSTQYITCGYIADYAHPGKMVIVEFDGPIHSLNVEYDRRRDDALSREGWRVLRFTNESLKSGEELVYRQIRSALNE